MPAFEAASADDPGEAASLPDGPPAVAVLFSGAVEPAGVPSGHLASILGDLRFGHRRVLYIIK